jgi:hypothetical protein
MRLDCRLYVRDLALAATLFCGAGIELGLLRAKSERLSEYKKSKVRLGSVMAQDVAGAVSYAVVHLWVQGKRQRNCFDPNLKGVRLVNRAFDKSKTNMSMGGHYDDSTFPAMQCV